MWYAGIAISRLNWKYDRGAKTPLPFSLTESNKYCKIEAAKGDLTLNGWEGRNTGEIAIKNGIIDIFEYQ